MDSKSYPLDFSIIVPVLNEERHIDICFSAIAGLKTPVDRYEVMLIDNGSTDRTLALAGEYANRFNLVIYSKPGIHISAMRNFGVSKARGKILAFLDADCIVSDQWLNHARQTFQRELVAPRGGALPAIAGAAYQIPPDSTWVAKAWNINASNLPVAGPVAWIPSGNMFVEREAFFAVGGFNENIQTNEDYDLCQRIRARGYSVISDPEIAVVHVGTPQDISSFFRKEHWHGKDVFKVYLESGRTMKNSKAVAFALFYAALLAGFVFAGIVTAITGRFIFLEMCLLFAFCVPVALAIKVSFAAGQYRHICGLSVLYTVYGIARAFCIFKVSTGVFQAPPTVS